MIIEYSYLWLVFIIIRLCLHGDSSVYVYNTRGQDFYGYNREGGGVAHRFEVCLKL